MTSLLMYAYKMNNAKYTMKESNSWFHVGLLRCTAYCLHQYNGYTTVQMFWVRKTLLFLNKLIFLFSKDTLK